jgi:hypothetical protein
MDQYLTAIRSNFKYLMISYEDDDLIEYLNTISEAFDYLSPGPWIDDEFRIVFPYKDERKVIGNIYNMVMEIFKSECADKLKDPDTHIKFEISQKANSAIFKCYHKKNEKEFHKFEVKLNI